MKGATESNIAIKPGRSRTESPNQGGEITFCETNRSTPRMRIVALASAAGCDEEAKGATPRTRKEPPRATLPSRAEPNVRIRGVREPLVKTKRVSVRIRTVESEWND